MLACMHDTHPVCHVATAARYMMHVLTARLQCTHVHPSRCTFTARVNHCCACTPHAHVLPTVVQIKSTYANFTTATPPDEFFDVTDLK